MSRWLPLAQDPRFASIFDKCQAEVNRVQAMVTAQTLRQLCVMRFFDADGVETHQRPATDLEIQQEGAFTEAKQFAYAVGSNAARACAKRLTKQYDLAARYAAH